MYHTHLPLTTLGIRILLRYFLFAGSAYLVFYILRPRKWSGYKIQPRFPQSAAIRTEIYYSILTAAIFTLVVYVFLFSPLSHYTRMYPHIRDRGIPYYIFSILAAVILHDTYFYWTHRFMHWRKVFPYVHHVHHKSHNPTPWAAYAFHPLEALIEAGIIPVIVFTIPIQGSAIGIFGLIMITMNVLGHLGYELYPRDFLRTRWLAWLNTSTHHNLHHHYSRSNYGLYFNIWDQLMNTNDTIYRHTFESVRTRTGSQRTVIPTLRGLRVLRRPGLKNKPDVQKTN